MLADMATELDAARMLTYRAAAAKATQPRCTTEAAMAKLYASEAAHRAADHAMQIFAAAGYARGSTVERLVRDVRATEIYQGTSAVQRMVIAPVKSLRPSRSHARLALLRQPLEDWGQARHGSG